MTKLRRESFQEFLCRRLGDHIKAVAWPNRWSGAGNTLGGIALRAGALSLPDVERILQQQSNQQKLFGKTAVDLGLLTESQVELLLELQRLHLHLEQGEAAVLQERLDVRAMLEALREYLLEQSAAALGKSPADGVTQ
jgi:hypothetical protein